MNKFTYLFVLIFTFTFSNVSFSQAPIDWMHMSPEEGYYGIGMNEVYSTILKDKKSVPVVVAILDSGIDIDHEDLKDVIWVNEGEIPGNNIDDDGNGYVDDVYGWNFIGGPDGKNVHHDTYEVTRLYAKHKYKYEDANPKELTRKQKKEYEQFLVYKEEVEQKRASAKRGLEQMMQTQALFTKALAGFEEHFGDNEITEENLSELDTEGDMQMEIGKRAIGQMLKQIDKPLTVYDIRTMLTMDIQEGIDHYQNQVDYAYNPDFDSRTIVQDNYKDQEERYYGNNDVEGPDALHGTHVAGIVGATRNNDIGMNGIADNVRLMSVRTVPDGDERDKDVANAIRYAVDNGALVINMSFGKGYSWNKKVVDDAVKYAEKNDVLLVHAAGNSAQNNDEYNNFPNRNFDRKCFLGRKAAKNWIEVGALNYSQDESLVAPFSNYAKKDVDVFAPGMAIYATVPDNQYQFLQGTSMAAPVVAGLAAALRSYYPRLTAEQVKEIIISSSTVLDTEVRLPGSNELVPFSQLSNSGGYVNAVKAFELAAQTKGKRKLSAKEKALLVQP
jgi:cell wall-associated protease